MNRLKAREEEPDDVSTYGDLNVEYNIGEESVVGNFIAIDRCIVDVKARRKKTGESINYCETWMVIGIPTKSFKRMASMIKQGLGDIGDTDIYMKDTDKTSTHTFVKVSMTESDTFLACTNTEEITESDETPVFSDAQLIGGMVSDEPMFMIGTVFFSVAVMQKFHKAHYEPSATLREGQNVEIKLYYRGARIYKLDENPKLGPMWVKRKGMMV
eukprot:FR735747.1.p2 GENE.FR735747.1~~FR735747.1.p2  ORF type:complete len:232 (+),score=25.84 FR735747.1:56-697(+)